MIDINRVIDITRNAGKIIMSYYSSNNLDVQYKQDSSPVSKADLESNNFICRELKILCPEIPIISEENEPLNFADNTDFWLIDPLDGTKSFLAKEYGFAINIALIRNKRPILGVVYSPLTNELYYVGQDNIPYKSKENSNPEIIKTRKVPAAGSTVLLSRYAADNQKLQDYLETKSIDKVIFISSALKICKIAEGEGDLYPRFGKTMEWDTAAGDAILSAAGGKITDLDGKILTYGNTRNNYQNPEFIAFGNKL